MRIKTFRILGALVCILSIGGATAKAAAPAAPTGFINYRTYPGDPRNAVRDGTAVPDASFYPKRAEGPYNGIPGADPGDDTTPPAGDVRNNYVMELEGYFYPPKTGRVMLAIACDDPGELYLSTDENPSNKVLIATESQWNPVRAFGGGDPTAPTRRSIVTTGNPSPRPQNWSPYINVVAGKPYYLHAFATEWGGGDNLAVAFRYEGDPDFADGDLPIPGSRLAPFEVPTGAAITDPVDQFVYAGGPARFAVNVDVGPTGKISSIKWQKNGVDVPNSNALTLNLSNVAAADNGAKYKAVVVTSAGTVTSKEATLNVAGLNNVFAPGLIKWEVWRDIGGNAVSALTDDPRYPNQPSELRILGAYDAPVNVYEAFGGRLSGFVIPPANGNYVLFLSADDNAELFLSTDDNPANKKLIARESAWSNTKQWTVSGGNSDLTAKRSDEFAETQWPTGNTITLVGGRRYYTELLYKEGGGGDNAAATMILAGSPNPANGTTTLVGPMIGANAQPTLGDVTITKQPVFPKQLEEGRSYTFSTDGTVAPAGFNFPLIIQWQKNGTAIPGASGKSLTILNAKASDAGTYRAVLSTVSGRSVNSTEAALTVVPDTFAPVATAGALLKGGKQEISIAFDESVKAATASVAANYSLSAGTIDSVRVVNRPATGFDASLGVTEYNSSSVIVASGLTAGQTYSVTVKNVEDLKGNKSATGQTLSFKAEDKKTWTIVGANESGFANDVVRVGDEGFDVISSGVAFWADYDEAVFVQEQITGNFDKIVQLEYQDPSSQWARTGLMAREALNEGKARIDRGACTVALEADGTYCIPKANLFSRMQTVHLNPTIRWDAGVANNAYENHWRAEDTYTRGFGDQLQSADGGFGPLNYPNQWMRLARQGDRLLTYRSTDGQNWTPMTSRVFAGLAPTLFVGPFSAPELNNNGTKAGLDHGVLAKFRNYRDFGTVVQPPPGDKPTLSLARTATGLTLTFTGTLQSADAITGPWTDVTGASPQNVPTSGARKFYRAKK